MGSIGRDWSRRDFGEQHLRHLLPAILQRSPYAAIAEKTPIPRDAQRGGRMLALPILGGLHHRYVRV
jgi:hypothetical protein